MAVVRRCHQCHAPLDPHTSVSVTVDAAGTSRHGVAPRGTDAALSPEELDLVTLCRACATLVVAATPSGGSTPEQWTGGRVALTPAARARSYARAVSALQQAAARFAEAVPHLKASGEDDFAARVAAMSAVARALADHAARRGKELADQTAGEDKA
jgi:hypothetical protein